MSGLTPIRIFLIDKRDQSSTMRRGEYCYCEYRSYPMLSWHYMHENPLWIYPKEDPFWKESIIKEFKIHPVTAQILVSRGFSSLEQIHDYLYAKLPDLYDPFLMAEMPNAV